MFNKAEDKLKTHTSNPHYYKTIFRKHPLDDLTPNHFWPDKRADITDTLKIIAKHADLKKGIKFVDRVEENGDDLLIIMPKWLVEVIEFFSPLYGPDCDEIVTQIMYVLMGSDGDLESEFLLKRIYKRQNPPKAAV